MIIVDTTVWIDYLGGFVNPETTWLNRELTSERLALTDLILSEVLQGIQNDSEFHRVRSDLLEFEIFDSGGLSLALASAETIALYGSSDSQCARRSIVLSPAFVLKTTTLFFTVTAISMRSRSI